MTLDVALAAPAPDLVFARFARHDGAVLVPVWLGLDGWDRRSRKPRPDAAPRRVEVDLSEVPRRVRLHRFGDDGTVSVSALSPGRRVTVDVTDRLGVLELS